MNSRMIKCTECGFEGDREYLERSCGNCFACMGCEIYYCPRCGEEIVIRPFSASVTWRDHSNGNAI